jgi:hypothetical protein
MDIGAGQGTRGAIRQSAGSNIPEESLGNASSFAVRREWAPTLPRAPQEHISYLAWNELEKFKRVVPIYPEADGMRQISSGLSRDNVADKN